MIVRQKKEDSEDKYEVWKNIIINVLCPFLQRLLFNEKEWHPEFDPHFFMHPFLKTLDISKSMRTTTVCRNIVVRSIS